MASLRRLKKEIEFLSSQMIGDSIEFLDVIESKDQEIWQIIDATVTLHNQTIDKVNHPDGKDNKKLVKSYYKKIKLDYIAGLNEGYAQLEALLKAAK